MNLYLINIESYHLIEKEIKKIVKDNIFISYNMANASIKELIDEANYLSLDGNKKYIIASNSNFFGSDKISDEESNLLSNYLNITMVLPPLKKSI